MKIPPTDLTLRLSALAASAITTCALLGGIDRLAQPDTLVAAEVAAGLAADIRHTSCLALTACLRRGSGSVDRFAG